MKKLIILQHCASRSLAETQLFLMLSKILIDVIGRRVTTVDATDSGVTVALV